MSQQIILDDHLLYGNHLDGTLTKDDVTRLLKEGIHIWQKNGRQAVYGEVGRSKHGYVKYALVSYEEEGEKTRVVTAMLSGLGYIRSVTK